MANGSSLHEDTYLKVNVDFSFLSFARDDFPAIDHKTIRRYLVIQLEALLG